MSRTFRATAGALALATAVGSVALAPSAAAGVDDSVTMHTTGSPTNITVFPQGSPLVGPVNVQIGTVSLLSQVIGPIG